MNAGTRGIVLVAVVAVLVASVAFGVIVVSNQFASTSSSTSATAGCAQTASSAKDTNMATVYNVTSTRAVLCVTYKFGGAGNADFFTTVQPWYQTGNEVTSSQCSGAGCPVVTASPSSADHGADTYVSVIYTITSSANLTGLYILFQAGCDPLYLAFGSVPSSVYLTAWTCGPSNVISGGYRSDNYNVTGVTNIQTVSVPWR